MKRFRGHEQVIDDELQFADARADSGRLDIGLRVADRAGQHVQIVVQRVELVASDHQLVLTQLEFGRTLT